jgi:hypothetical protein
MSNNYIATVAVVAMTCLSFLAIPLAVMTLRERPAAQLAPTPVPPQPQAPPVIEKQIIIKQAPVRQASMYDCGWADAKMHKNPDPRLRDNPEYIRGYRDYCRKHRPGFILNIDVR